jgi:hypothetical protein
MKKHRFAPSKALGATLLHLAVVVEFFDVAAQSGGGAEPDGALRQS